MTDTDHEHNAKPVSSPPGGAGRDVSRGSAVSNVGSFVSSVLARFGVTADHDAVLSTASEVFAERGHQVRVVSLRHGTLIVEAPSSVARLLLWDLDPVRDELAARTDGAVTELTVRSAR